MTARPFALFLALLLVACAPTPRLNRRDGFTPRPEQEKLYVLPFMRVMVPWDLSEEVFDRFVDHLNASALPKDYRFAILKTPLKEIDPEWLRNQHYLSGDLFGYRKDSGCCSTLLQLTGRIRFHQPGREEPTLEFEYPAERFFEHDYTTLDQEQRILAEQIADQLASQFLDAFFAR